MANWLTRRASFWTQAFYSKVRAVMGIFITAFTILLIIRDGIVDPSNREWVLLKLIPNLPWYWWLVIGTVALLVLTLEGAYDVYAKEIAGFQRRYRTRLKENRKEYTAQLASAGVQALLAEKLPKKEVTVTDAEQRLFGEKTVSLPSAKEPKQDTSQPEKENVRPIECIRAYITRTLFSGKNSFVILNEVEEGNEETFITAVAEFVNSPKAKGWVPPIEFLRAQITFYDSQGNFCHRVGDCFWLGEQHPYMQLDAGGRAKLTIAFQLKEGEIMSVENWNDNLEQYEKRSPATLTSKSFSARVHLTGGRHSEIHEDFKFDLICEPDFSINLEGINKKLVAQDGQSNKKSKLAETIRQLGELAEEGRQILIKYREKSNVDWTQANDWAARAETFIKECAGEDSAAYFALTLTKPYPGLAVDRRFVDLMHTRIQKIGEIVSELRKR